MKQSEVIEKLIAKMRLTNKSEETIKSYAGTVRYYCKFLTANPGVRGLAHNKRVESYLTWRVQEDEISASTQNVEFNALIYLYKNIFEIELKDIHALRAKYHQRVPPILTRQNVGALLDNLPNSLERIDLIGKVLYGTGMRLNECLRLRIKDIDLANNKLVIHEGKGDKDGIVELPASLVNRVSKQMGDSVLLWEQDHKEKVGVSLPRALEKKYKTAAFSMEWYWLFPNTNLAIDPRTKRLSRHHVYDFTVQEAFVETRRKCKLPEYTTPHALRHAFATHFTENMLKKGMPERVIYEVLRGYLRHVSKQTLDWYIHLATPSNPVFELPIETMYRESV